MNINEEGKYYASMVRKFVSIQPLFWRFEQ